MTMSREPSREGEKSKQLLLLQAPDSVRLSSLSISRSRKPRQRRKNVSFLYFLIFIFFLGKALLMGKKNFRWCKAGSRRLHILQCVSRKGLILWRLEHNFGVFCRYSNCELNFFVKTNLIYFDFNFLFFYLFYSGPLPDSPPSRHIPQGPSGFADLHHIRTHLLLCDKRNRQTVR